MQRVAAEIAASRAASEVGNRLPVSKSVARSIKLLVFLDGEV